MKYGESTFDVLYLLFAIVSGILILRVMLPYELHHGLNFIVA